MLQSVGVGEEVNSAVAQRSCALLRFLETNFIVGQCWRKQHVSFLCLPHAMIHCNISGTFHREIFSLQCLRKCQHSYLVKTRLTTDDRFQTYRQNTHFQDSAMLFQSLEITDSIIRCSNWNVPFTFVPVPPSQPISLLLFFDQCIKPNFIVFM